MKKSILIAGLSISGLVLLGAIAAYGRGGGGHGGGFHGGGFHGGGFHGGEFHGGHAANSFGWDRGYGGRNFGEFTGRNWNAVRPEMITNNYALANHLPERDAKPNLDRQFRQTHAKDARNRFNQFSKTNRFDRDHHRWNHNRHWDHWHRWDHGHWRFNPNNNWWAWATFGALGGWIAADWAQPVYYNYGDNIYYSGDGVYLDGRQIATAEQYAQQAEQLAESVPGNLNVDSLQWMPLGVFALVPEGTPSGDPTMYVQIAVTKQGIIGGTYFNDNTRTTKSIQGAVDKKTQRAAWAYIGDKWPVMETGIYNLTQDDAPALVHFQNGSTQQWTLVRLQKPEDDAATNLPATE